jgi:PPK2 family polyphosphate:nucleotide phosphotransferase
MDTGGKDGTIRRVLGSLNPQGVRVVSFKAPTPEERAHDYLWRVHREIPARGMIGVFNRSHYEDVLVAKVRGLAPPREIEARYGQINRFERHLSENGVVLVKFFLHISKEEQKARLQARLDDPRKRWKFDPADLAERKRWDEYQEAYETALRRCSSPWAPWYVIPGDHKWARNLAVARILRLTLEGMKLRYPPAPPGLPRRVAD